MDEEFESGPYCQHWYDPYDCPKLCVCGHKCCEHPGENRSWACKEQNCECEDFEDKE